MTTPEKFYYPILILIGCVSVLIILLIPNLALKIALLIILMVPLGLGFFLRKEVLNIFLSYDYLEKYGLAYYKVKWVSKKFDLFAGEEILTLREDSLRLRYLATHYGTGLYDYSFVVLPMAKAYEGFLKKILVKIELVTELELFQNPDISINKYFNPIGNNSIFNSLRDKVRDRAIPHLIYTTYQECRNQILHYDPYGNTKLATVEDASFFLRRIEDAIVKAYDTFEEPIEKNTIV